MRTLSAADGLGLARGSALVCVPTYRGGARTLSSEQVLETALALLAFTDQSVPVVLAGSAEELEELAGETLFAGVSERIVLAACDGVPGATGAVNAVTRMSAPGDVVVVAPGVRVTSEWLTRLQQAAASDSTVASATPLSTAPPAQQSSAGRSEGNSELPAGVELSVATPVAADKGNFTSASAGRPPVDEAAALLPRIATMGPGCVYIRRRALDIAGPLDERLSLDMALADLAVRQMAAGMVHVAADNVVVCGSYPVQNGNGESARDSSPVVQQVQDTFANDERGRLQRALATATLGLRALSVTIDARALTSTIGGTQTYMLELVLALAREDDVQLRVLVAHDLSRRAADAFATVPGIELLTYEHAIEGVAATDVVHRPQSVFTPDDLTLLRLLGNRLIVGQLDLIAYHDYSYHADIEQWRGYRRTTRLALGIADQVVFFSEHARRDALAEDLLPEARAHVVAVGADALEPAVDASMRPDGIAAGQPFLLCLGADYAHKNRPFAIELLGALRDLGWPGVLVLAGAHVPHGSSRARERELLEGSPQLAASVHDFGLVEESSKQWLLGHARALLYPTLYEGFGLLPLEAGRAGVPCLFAQQASLDELAGKAATLVPWDAGASATRVLPLLVDGSEREAHLAMLRELPVPSWSSVAGSMIDVYRRAIAAPPAEGAPRMWQDLDRERYIAVLDEDVRKLKGVAQEYQDAFHDLTARVQDGLPLIDRGGLLDPDQQRGLMRIAARRPWRGLLLGPIGLVGRWANAPRSISSSTQSRPDGDRRA